jgi:2-iminobutanoate/2-iminopropanoate deaminase
MRKAIDRPGTNTTLPFSMAVETSGRLLFISGQGPIDPASGEIVAESFEQQARLTLDNLKAVTDAGGGSLSNAVKVNAYLRDMDDFPVFNEIYREYFPEPRPARTTVPAALPRFDIEVDAIIALDVDDGAGPEEEAGG